MDLTSQKCVPCEGGVDPMTPAQVAEYLAILTLPWENKDNKHIAYTFNFKNFVEAMAFVNKVAEIAEAEGHHPDMAIRYNKVTIDLWTHAIGGLSMNDFVLAAKIERCRDTS